MSQSVTDRYEMRVVALIVLLACHPERSEGPAWAGRPEATQYDIVIKGGDKSAKDVGPKDKDDGFAERVIEAVGAHDVWFENLTISHGRHAIVAHEASRLVVRGCHMHDVFFGVTAPSRLRIVTAVRHVPKKRMSEE